MNKLISALIATVFASALSFNAIAAKHMGGAPTEAPAGMQHKEMHKEMNTEKKMEKKEEKEEKKAVKKEEKKDEKAGK